MLSQPTLQLIAQLYAPTVPNLERSMHMLAAGGTFSGEGAGAGAGGDGVAGGGNSPLLSAVV